MRGVWLGFAVLAFAGCDSNPPSAPADNAQEPATIDGVVVLNGEGLSVGAEAFYFAAGQTEVQTALARELGKPGEIAEMSECGAGPMESARFAGALTVNFQNGALVGWTLNEARDNIATDGGFNIGVPQIAVEVAPGFSLDADSTLGEEFAIEGGYSGFFEQGKVSMLYAGTQCFFR